ncbi:MAG: methyltransferase domain-containing protein, partial [Anaerolineae bacterium]|nr:methyltransferase domain-containing protein [Anaerolineae bacterium]
MMKMDPYIKLPRAQIVHGRQTTILAYCQNKRVLHLGCVDAGLLHARFQDEVLMHQKLAAVASELWGVDVDEECIDFLREHGFQNLMVGDICQLEQTALLREKNFDVIVASEVLEHVNNPGQFLDTVRALMSLPEAQFIVSVPNAFRIDNLLWMFRKTEYIHPDHNYWFSYYTITNLLNKNGFDIQKVYAYSLQPWGILPVSLKKRLVKRDQPTHLSEIAAETIPSMPFLQRLGGYLRSLPRRVIVQLLYKITPFWGEGIIVVATFVTLHAIMYQVFTPMMYQVFTPIMYHP